MVDKKPMSPWAWSTNEESFHGADCEETAHDEAKDYLNANSSPGEEQTYWVGETEHPLDVVSFIDKPQCVGESFFEQINEWAYNELGCDEDPLEMSENEITELGHIILRYIREHAAVKYFGVDNITRHSHTTTGD